MIHLSNRDDDYNLQLFKHTELQPMTYETVTAIMITISNFPRSLIEQTDQITGMQVK